MSARFAALALVSSAVLMASDWVRQGVIYEINPRAFSATGDFVGIAARLDQIQSLGVTILWIMPIHPPGKEKSKGAYGSPYAVRDYYAIDPAYGTKDDFRRLVQQAHARGFKVILDIVADHTSWDSVMMAHPQYYKHDAAGNIMSPDPGWTDVAALNYNDPGLRLYMTRMLAYWLREFDLDGFRCDVAGMTPTSFWEAARLELEKVKPDLFMLAEWHDPALLEKAFDADYSWPLHRALTAVFEDGTLPASALADEWREERRIYPSRALHMRFSDNHDEKRAIARFGERGALAASALMFTLDGVPLLYNGMEVGDTTESGAPTLFERLPIFWPIAERLPEFRPFYQRIIALRRAHAALQQGETEWIENSDPARILTYTRSTAAETLLVAINCSNQPFVGRVAIRGEFSQVFPLAEGAQATPDLMADRFQLDAWGYRVYLAEGIVR
jgi:glycosidase